MRPSARSLLKQVLPPAAFRRIRDVRTSLQALRLPATRRIFQAAPAAPAHLAPEALPPLQARYPALPEYGYDSADLARRGRERAAEVLGLTGAAAARTCLEIGCWDGMVSCALQQAGMQATAVDNRADGFDARASRAGVRLLRADAAGLQFESESFDVVFSYDTFEHLADPERVLQEAARVTRKGGHVFLQFGPLYLSPFGQHAYRSIRVPYCHVLFAKQALQDFASRSALAPIEFADVNEWSLGRYRELWAKFDGPLRRVEYREIRELAHLDLVRDHPSCFRARSGLLDDFLVTSIHVVFQKPH
jgi:SAM-dependent methyltransferase